MRKTRILGRWRSWLCGAAALVLAACAEETLPDGGIALKEGEIALQWVPANMGVRVSRGTDTKNGEEQKITNVHIFLFGADGNYLQPGNEGLNAFQGYRHLTGGNTSWILQTDLFADQGLAANATVYVLANMPEGTFELEGVRPAEVPDMAALEALTVKLPTFTTDIPADGLPMVVKQTRVDLSDGAATKIVALQLKSMMARVDLNFTMDPAQETDDSRYPSLEFHSLKVGNFPNGGKVVSQLGSGAGETVVDGYELMEKEVTDSPILNKVLQTGNEQSVTFYMFEHGRAVNEAGRDDIPDLDEDDLDKAQRYKNYLAKEDAAYIEFTGNYVSQNQFRYRVTYRLYVGGNATDDFTIKPNCQYKNNITVTGISVNNYGDEALLDTRVTIDEDTPAFIEMLRERQFDSHFNVTPMDIYLNGEGASVTVEILNADETPWVRMEPYRHAPAAKCDYKDNEGGYAATRAGDGKRKYFTTGLMSELNNDYNVSYTVTQPEERIYFYIDENVPTQAQYNAHSDVPERRATIRITYTAADGTKNYQDATFVQAGMRIVRFNKFSNGGFSLRRQEYWFYIEEYEEYLAHYDGKNEYTDTYEGLGWGLDGLESGLGVQDGYDFWQFMSWGWYNTNQIMEKYREQRLWATAEETREEEMTLNTKPSGAAEYCYNKNKRNEDGSVDDVEWYLPTISELEFAIDEYYGTYEVFQNKWYWSSNPGAEGKWNSNEYTNTGNYGENEKEARATKSLYNGSGYEHAVSAANEKYPTYRKWERDWWGGGQWSEEEYEGGSALRTYKFRIRAAYIPEWGKPTDVNPYRRW